MFGSTATARLRRRHRIAARLQAGSIDRALIAGEDTARSPELQARAERLGSRASRLALAGWLERLLAADPHSLRRTRVRPARESLHTAEPALRELAALLRAPGPLHPRGLAMVNELLADGSGPLYARGGAAALERALSEARGALCGTPAGAPAIPAGFPQSVRGETPMAARAGYA